MVSNMDIEAPDQPGSTSTERSQTFAQRLAKLGGALLPKSWREDRNGFSRLADDEDGPTDSPQVERPTGNVHSILASRHDSNPQPERRLNIQFSHRI